MPRAIRRKTRKVRRRAIRRKAKVASRGQYAQLVETYTPPLNGQLGSNQIHQGYFNLALFPRAQQVSMNYRWYRPVKVEWEYAPRYNTFQEDPLESNATVPMYYSVMNRTQNSSIPVDVANYQQFMISQGARPYKFDKIIKKTYRPNWCSSGLVGAQIAPGPSVVNVAMGGFKAEYGWTPCPSSSGVPGTVFNSGVQQQFTAYPSTAFTSTVATEGVIFNGHQALIVQINPGPAAGTVADVTCRVTWEFKGAQPQYTSLREPPPVEAA